MHKKTVPFLVALFTLALATVAVAKDMTVVALEGSGPLLEVRFMVKSGSSHDPAGLEGLANVTAEAFLEGGFGDPDAPITKEDLARMTRSWGQGARPQVRVAKEATTFRFTVPVDVLDEYVETILAPMFSSPHFAEDEVRRLANEAATNLTGFLRYESVEMLGLESLDNYMFDGTSYAHTSAGSVQGLAAVTDDAVRGFYAKHYKPENAILGVSTDDPAIVAKLTDAMSGLGKVDGKKARVADAKRMPPPPIDGRELTIIAKPDELATGIHLGFPIEVNRTHPDYWPLYVASVYLGTHRDGHGVLYKQIRQERGYNYGDYAYIEHFAMRPWFLFPPFNFPREHQYFSMWIRPVGHAHAHHLLKAAVFELENLLRRGVPADEVEASKNKAKVLYLNLAETKSRLLEAKVDDAFYGLETGYLDGYLEKLDAVTVDQVNDAVRRHLQSDNLKILMVTDADRAETLAEDIAQDRNNTGKSLEDYELVKKELEDGTTVWEVPETRITTLRRDAQWSGTWLGIPSDRIRVVPVERIFETGELVAEPTGGEAR